MGNIKKTPMVSLICSFLSYLSIIASNKICVDVASVQLDTLSLSEVIRENISLIPKLIGVTKNHTEGTILLGAQERSSLYLVAPKIQ